MRTKIHLPKVRSDKQAFQNVLGRLEGEVGAFVGLIVEARKQGRLPHIAPFWSFARMLFPVAEAVGDLIYQDKPVKNLKHILENEFEAVRSGYKGKAALIALLYRHSLAHTDEMRILVVKKTKVIWKLTLGGVQEHLKVERVGKSVYRISFDLTTFGDDLRVVCRNTQDRRWKGKVRKRYNEWLKYNLESKTQSATDREAIAEIGGLRKSLGK